jgi:hypothetical protein
MSDETSSDGNNTHSYDTANKLSAAARTLEGIERHHLAARELEYRRNRNVLDNWDRYLALDDAQKELGVESDRVRILECESLIEHRKVFEAHLAEQRAMNARQTIALETIATALSRK